MKLCLNILCILSILVIVCLVVICVISFIENRRLVVTSYSIKSEKLPKEFSDFRMVHLSDLHNATFGLENHILMERIKELSPDIILITGDMIVGKPEVDVKVAVDTMNQLTAIAPVYFSMGNHELRASIYTQIYGDMWEQFKNGLDRSITILRDESVCLERNGQKIVLSGLDLTPQLYKRFRHTPMEDDYLNQVLGVCENHRYHICMAHNPDYFKQYAKWGADLTLSGHIHGGMIRIPFFGGVISPMVLLFPTYDKGLYKYLDKYMVLSGGLGNHTLKFRVNNLPEIVFITLQATS